MFFVGVSAAASGVGGHDFRGKLQRLAANDVLTGIAVVLLAILVYANSLKNGFVWDDDYVILTNLPPAGQLLSLLTGIDSGRPTELMPYYRPLTLFSFALERQIHGLEPWFIRLVNVLLHAANCLLVQRLSLKVSGSHAAALLCALLFAVHPLQSEAVCFNAGGRNTMLATFFVLAAYLIHAAAVSRFRNCGLVIGPLLFGAGLFAKETALALLPFIVALEYGGLRSRNAVLCRAAWLRLFPYVIVTGGYLLARHFALSRAGVELQVFAGLGGRLLDNVYLIPRYGLNVVWPQHLSPRYFMPESLHQFALPLVLAWVAIVGVAWRLYGYHQRQAVWFGITWVVAFWLPVSGIFPIPSAPMADRYCYLPAIGLWLLIADQVVLWAERYRTAITASLAIAGVVLLLLAVVTVRQNRIWHDDFILFSRLVEQYPDKAYGYYNLGCAFLEKKGDLDQAEQWFAKALSLEPGFPRLRTQLGYVQFKRGDFDGAVSQYDHALYLDPQDAEAWVNRGKSLEELGRYAEAVASYRRFLELPGGQFAVERDVIAMRVQALSTMPDHSP